MSIKEEKTHSGLMADQKHGKEAKSGEGKKKKKDKKTKHRERQDEAAAADAKAQRREERKERKRKHAPLSEAAAAAIVGGIAEGLEQAKQAAPAPDAPEAKRVKKAVGDASRYTYTQSAALSALPAKEVTDFLTTHSITLSSETGAPLPEDVAVAHRPILRFAHVDFPPLLAGALASAGFANPTPIQAVTWPWTLSGRDMVGIAKTGSGKTLAFGIPALIHLQNAASTKRNKPQVLVLSPTRELAMQIQEQFDKFGADSARLCKSVCLYGGVSKHEQKKALAEGANILIATPGRLLDLVEEGCCDLRMVQFLVLDEADRMLDQGFEEAIRRILGHLPTARQTLMFSATWPVEIQRLSQKYLVDPVRVTVGSTDLTANDMIEQRVEVIDPFQKESRLLQLLKDYHRSRKNRILIFALYKKEAARLETALKRQGYAVAAIHGDLSQAQRTQAIEGFKDGSVPLLIATDVAARGIDIPNVEYVINVTFPLTVEDYCHRIGRTGRAGKTGVSHTLFTHHDKTHSGALINVLKQAKQPVPPALLAFGTTVKKKVDPNYGAFARELDLSLKPTKVVFGNDSDSD